MPQELKARIPDITKLEERLCAAGAKFIREIHCTDTYFHQPKGSVLKIVRDNDGTFLTKLREKEGAFEQVERGEINSPDELYAQLTEAHGIHRTLTKRRRIFKLGPNTIDLNLIEGVGDFVILLGESPSEAQLTDLLGEEPQFIRVPFSDL